MRRLSQNLVYLLVLVLLAGSMQISQAFYHGPQPGMQSVAVGQDAPHHSGTVTVTATSIAAGLGWTWGAGTLTLLDGSQHRFTVGGLDVVSVGIKQVTAVGHVYNLKNVQDFAGMYVKAAAGLVVGGGVGATTMQNDKGVVINLTGVGQGVEVNLSVSGMDVQLVN